MAGLGTGVFASLLMLALLLLFLRCLLRRHRRGSRATVADELMEGQLLKEGELPWFETRVYLETDELECDFTMRVEYAELDSRDLLLESIARAGFEATEFAFDFRTASMERLDDGTLVRTDEDCRNLRGVKGLRISTLAPRREPPPRASPRAADAQDGDASLLLQPVDDD